MGFFTKRREPKRFDAAADPEFSRFRERHAGFPDIDAWEVLDHLRAPQLPLDDRTVELWRVHDPAGLRPYAAAMRETGGALTMIVFGVERPDGVLLSVYAEGRVSHVGPLPGRFTDPQDWHRLIMPMLARVLEREQTSVETDVDTPSERVRAAEHPWFVDFAARSTAPHLISWRELGVLQVPPESLGGGRIDIWHAVLAHGPIQYPHIAVGVRADESIVAMIAAETMPESHQDLMLGLFADGTHTNLGSAPHVADPEAFAAAALGLLRPIMQTPGGAVNS